MNSANTILLVKTIVDQQRQIMGPMAIEEANKVQGLKISMNLDTINVTGQSVEVLNNLVMQYKSLFGQVSVEVCRDSVKAILHKISSADELPGMLR